MESAVAYLKIISQHPTGRSEENDERPVMWPAFELKFEPRT
jgi:hypothetical protein